MLHSLFYLTTALHVSGVTITHLQEHKTTVTTASGNRYTVLLSAAIVEQLELIWVCCGWRKPPTTGNAVKHNYLDYQKNNFFYICYCFIIKIFVLDWDFYVPCYLKFTMHLYYTFPEWKLWCVLNSRYYTSLFESLEQIMFFVKQMASLKEK